MNNNSKTIKRRIFPTFEPVLLPDNYNKAAIEWYAEENLKIENNRPLSNRAGSKSEMHGMRYKDEPGFETKYEHLRCCQWTGYI
jgi:hypothetical protein